MTELPGRVVVHTPVVHGAGRPSRRVDILGTPVGKAYSVEDVVEFMRRAGLKDLEVDDPEYVRWEGGGPDIWE